MTKIIWALLFSAKAAVMYYNLWFSPKINCPLSFQLSFFFHLLFDMLFLFLFLHHANLSKQEYWCKRLHPKNVAERVFRQPPLRTSLKGGRISKKEFNLTKHQDNLLQAADSIGKKIQYNCPGFLPNKRQVNFLSHYLHVSFLSHYLLVRCMYFHVIFHHNLHRAQMWWIFFKKTILCFTVLLVILRILMKNFSINMECWRKNIYV